MVGGGGRASRYQLRFGIRLAVNSKNCATKLQDLSKLPQVKSQLCHSQGQLKKSQRLVINSKKSSQHTMALEWTQVKSVNWSTVNWLSTLPHRQIIDTFTWQKQVHFLRVISVWLKKLYKTNHTNTYHHYNGIIGRGFLVFSLVVVVLVFIIAIIGSCLSLTSVSRFIVYDVAQLNIKYLVKCKFNYSY